MFDGRFFGEQWEEHVGPFNLLIEIYTTYTHTHTYITYIRIYTWYYNILYRTTTTTTTTATRTLIYYYYTARETPLWLYWSNPS